MVLLVSTICIAGQEIDRMDRTFPAKERPLIYVRNSDGRVRLNASSSQAVRVVAIKEAVRGAGTEEARREAARIEIRIEQVGNRIEAEAKYPRWSGNWNHGPMVLVHFEITGPAASDVDAHTSDGALEVDGFSGQLDLSTSDGKLTATNCAGSIKSHVSDGEMRITRMQGGLEARSSDGPMLLEGTFKGLDIRSSDGKVDITVRPGSAMDRPWSVQSSDGDVRLQLPEGFSADLDVSTSDGRIQMDHPVTMTGGKISEHHITGKLNAGGPTLRIHASDGSVTIAK
jgi:DUF4097 and DUF4098 domain-containing protein YvlB